MQIVQPGDTLRADFVVANSSGVAINADSLPTAQFMKNGAVDGAVTVTVANVETGAYTVSATVPTSYTAGDVVRVLFTAVVSTNSTKQWSAPVTVSGFPADALPDAAAPSVVGTVSDWTPSAGDFDAATGLSSSDDFYNGALVVFTSGTLRGIARKVSDYVGARRTFSFTGATGEPDAPFPAAPANGDAFLVIGRG